MSEYLKFKEGDKVKYIGNFKTYINYFNKYCNNNKLEVLKSFEEGIYRVGNHSFNLFIEEDLLEKRASKVRRL